jgi:hypothetical protein
VSGWFAAGAPVRKVPAFVAGRTRVVGRLVVLQTPMTGLLVASPFRASLALGTLSAMVWTL